MSATPNRTAAVPRSQATHGAIALFRWAQRHPARAGALSGWIQQLCSGLVVFATVPLIVQRLPETEAGIWFTLQTLAAILMITDFGFAFAAARQVAFTFASSAETTTPLPDGFFVLDPGWKGVSELYVALKGIYRWLIACAGLVMFTIHEIIRSYDAFLGHAGSSKLLVWFLFGITTIILLWSKVYEAILQGLGRVDAVRLAGALYQLACGIAAIAGLLMMGTLEAMAAGLCVVSIFYPFFLRMLLWRIANGQLDPHLRARSGLTRSLWRSAAPMGVMNMSSWLFGMVQVPLITALLHPALAPGFYAAQRITQMINAATLQVAVPQMPFFTRDVAQGAYCSAAKRMQRIIGGVTIAAGLIYGLLWVGGPIIAGWWLGPGKFVSRGVFGIMALDNTIGICSVIWAQFVLAAGRNCFMLSTVAAGAINLLVCVLLAPHWGLAGIASGTVIAGGLTNYWFAPREGIRVLRRLRQGAAP